MTDEGVWRRNLAALWLAEFTAVFGFSFLFPFLPLYLHQDLGVRGQAPLALLSGLAAGASGLGLAVTSPLWGMLADRHGRKPMLLRAMVGGGLTVALMGLTQTPAELIALRFLQGASSGTVAAATALVAGETPRARVGWALGVLGSSVAVGGAAGPLLGGILASVVGLRLVFLGGGILVLLSVIPVALVVREVSWRRASEPPPPVMAAIRGAGPGALGAIGVLVVAQGLLQLGYSSTQPLVVLRLLQLFPHGTSSVTGVAFAAAGLATAVAAVSYSRLARRIGYRPTAALGALLLAGSIVGAALAPSVPAVVLAVGLFGLLYGLVNPCVSGMIGLEAPPRVQARIFGAAYSAYAVGLAVGPPLSGGIAARYGVAAGMMFAAATALALAATLGALAREPAR